VINKTGVKKHTVSFGWVAKVLKDAGIKKERVKKSPSEKIEVKEQENQGANQSVINSPISEQEKRQMRRSDG
jgi:predicted urease superfamily metal-dependent hydrolase